MNTFIRGMLAGVLILCSFSVAAEEYTSTGANYSTATGSYTTGMMLTGTIVTSSAIPANATDLDILGLIDSFSFSDGVNTLTEADATLVGYNVFPSPRVSTDADGEITNWLFIALDLPLADALSETNTLMVIFGCVGYSVSPAAACTIVTMVPACNVYTFPSGVTASSATQGSWVKVDELPEQGQPIPGLTGYSLALTTIGLFLLGARRLRRRSAAQ